MSEERNRAIEQLEALARGEKPKTSDEEAVDFLVAFDNGGDIEVARKKREAMEWKKNNPLFES